jgi:hypothetical protein
MSQALSLGGLKTVPMYSPGMKIILNQLRSSKNHSRMFKDGINVLIKIEACTISPPLLRDRSGKSAQAQVDRRAVIS